MHRVEGVPKRLRAGFEPRFGKRMALALAARTQCADFQIPVLEIRAFWGAGGDAVGARVPRPAAMEGFAYSRPTGQASSHARQYLMIFTGASKPSASCSFASSLSLSIWTLQMGREKNPFRPGSGPGP